MPGNHASGTAGILTSSELNRDVAGVQGTYGWSTQSGAVTFSSGLIFNVAAVAAGDYTVNSVSGSVYAGGTTTLATQDPTNPRVDIIVITSAGAVSNVTGTPAALTTTSGPVPPTPSASQLEIARIYVPISGTALSASSITDRRHPMVGTPAVTLAGSSTASTSTTSTTAVDLVTISGLSILVTQGFQVSHNCLKAATSANYVVFGIKVNSTVIVEAVNSSGGPQSSATQQAEDGTAVYWFTPRSAAGYLCGFNGTYAWRVSSSGASSVNTNILSNLNPQGAPMPNATITSVAIRAKNNVSTNAAEVASIRILTGAM